MGRTYMPRADAKALLWYLNFADRLEEEPWRYGTDPSTAEAIRYVVDRFEAAMRVIGNPATKTPKSVSEKDQARALAWGTCKGLVQQIRAHRGVADADKIALRIPPMAAGRYPEFPAPDSAPVLNIVGCTRGSTTLTYADSMNPHRRAKPRGVTYLELYRVAADGPAKGPREARLYEAVTRTPFAVAWGHEDDKKVGTYFARWSTARGKVGPWSNGVSMTIAA